MPQTPTSRAICATFAQFDHLQPAELLRLAFYSLESALQPSGVYVDIDAADLTGEIEAIESLPPNARYSLALNLLQQCREA